ncbi:MAG: 1-deoxy-D-xylulose-5-phosphate synthase [Betaproteobacteria bacterium]|nr:1-deoxy-D-xylulose-5-phosphate synthase [Betaproteobacteria bacterium]
MQPSRFALLERVNQPEDLRRLAEDQLPALAQELRAFILDSVSKTGGHLSSNLGSVELSVALHYCYNTPYDRLIWDVGHQSYPHKILTGRREAMSTLRQLNGLSGFPKRSESPYDAFGTAHSSTSISAALGMALAARESGQHQGESRRRHVAVIGDGALSGGMAFEAMNHGGATRDLDVLVILNDNEMSISPPVGALSHYLTRLLLGRFYGTAKALSERLLKHLPGLLALSRRLEEHVKGMLTPSTLFEEFGFNYVGPIDGHDLSMLIQTLGKLRQRPGLKFLHVVTKKGQGYRPAEKDPILYHGPSPFKPEVGIIASTAQKPAPPTYTQVFGQWICDMAALDPRLVAITPAMREGSGLVEFESRFPSRYVDVGIAEQHAITLAAGLACEGMKPVVAIYSTFLQRGYDQLIHDVALQNLPVTFAIDRAGLVGADGATHAGAYDIAYLRCLPNMSLLAPSDEDECRQMLYSAFLHEGPAAVRYPRGRGPGVAVRRDLSALPWGKAQIRRAGKGVVLLAFGSMLAPALVAAEALNASVVNMRFIKPLDSVLLRQMANTHEAMVTIEEGSRSAGAGAAVAEALSEMGLVKPIRMMGLPDRFIDQGDVSALLASCGLDAKGIQEQVKQWFAPYLKTIEVETEPSPALKA